MKHLFYTLCIGLLFISCKNETKTTTEKASELPKATTVVAKSNYPENISKVFEAHGGIDNWNQMQSLAFTMTKPDGKEITTVNLKSRQSLITMPAHVLGYDGKTVWLDNKSDAVYKGNPKFYYNLMFYFHTMPFVLADKGVNYEDAKPLSFDGVDYPGIKISYDNGVGESSDDEYVLYYNPTTFKMEWLAYTVTFNSKAKSEKWSFIKYGKWHTIEGIALPDTLTWYIVEDNLPVKKRNDLQFTDVTLSKQALPASTFAKPETGTVVE
ncbi:DUF6503 family protein [Psychroserpens sp. NJDZ02]|uniref:DUF6503 family protein n=1 Tax=Psychroserpens sp. NJDZ02 TaxID=2570561 RepID=UPI0010A880F8|nr:DUF6503 family protein [Psychroserpens sp. NJDZ02]QCE42058.1 hypothetical protein E9099_11795 [Psychroserpens sp. NJDZ02]